MANVVNTTTGEYRVSVNEPDYQQYLGNWSPDLSAFTAVGVYRAKYDVLVPNSLRQLMTQEQRDAVDAAREGEKMAMAKSIQETIRHLDQLIEGYKALDNIWCGREANLAHEGK